MKYKILLKNIEFIIGILIISISFNLFLLPNNLLVGSISSLAIILNRYCNILPAFLILIAAIILLVLNFLYTKKITSKSISGIIFLIFLIQLTSKLKGYINIENNILLSTICGSLTIGIGCGLLLKQQDCFFTSLKTNSKLFVILTNSFITIIGGFLFGLTNTMYSLIGLYIMYNAIDKVLSNKTKYKLVYITTDQKNKIEKNIIDGQIYKIKQTNKNIYLCLITTKDYFKLKEQMNNVKSKNQLIVLDVAEVYNGK